MSKLDTVNEIKVIISIRNHKTGKETIVKSFDELKKRLK